jgi:hypothetical protein
MFRQRAFRAGAYRPCKSLVAASLGETVPAALKASLLAAAAAETSQLTPAELYLLGCHAVQCSRSLSLKTEAVHSSETSVNFYPTT